jgi:large subunit ribosomal protein L21
MYAIIQEGGGQRLVRKNEELLIDLLNEGQAKAGGEVSFDQVLVVGETGGKAKVGKPFVSGASVKAKVLDPVVLGDKIHIQKFQAKKAWQKKTGHRQRYSKVQITDIKG